MQERLQEAEARLQSLGRNLPGSVLFQSVREADGSRRFAFMGEGIERIAGVDAAELLADFTVFYRMIDAEDFSAYKGAVNHSYEALETVQVQFRIHRPDGEIRWIRMGATPRALGHGRVAWDGLLTDITGQLRAEAATRAYETQLAGVLRHLPGAVARLGLDLQVLYVNSTQAQWVDAEADTLIGKRVPEVISAQLMERMTPYFERAVRGETVVFVNRIDRPDGEVRYRHTTLVPERTADGAIGSIVLFAYDLTELKNAQSELQRQKALLTSLLKAMPDMVYLKDTQGVYQACNPVFERFMGRSEREILGRTDAELLAPAAAAHFSRHDRHAMQAWQPLAVEDTLVFAEDGYEGQFETILSPIRDVQGRTTGVLGVSRDITDRKQAAQEIERLAFYDPLTRLPNRRLLLDRLQRQVLSGQRTQQHGALLFIDLDNFKDLNDTLGHDMGDQLLAQVAARLSASVRECDTVARFGGDEFVVLLEGLDASEEQAARQAEIVARKLLMALNQPFELAGREHYSTPSIGLTLFGPERQSVDELLKRADLAMYEAKAAGRNTHRFFDPGMQQALHQRSSLEAELRQGLARGELFVHYQSVVDSQGHVKSAEALARWRHPERGLISPAEFIPLAEQTGLILPLGRQVLQTACSQLVRWSSQPETAHLSVAVNVSARQFKQSGFVAEVLHILRETGANPRRLRLELTESLLLGDIEDTIERMGQLKREGVGFALDDFGTGYSSLGYLKRLPLDQVKIDRGFVRDVLSDPNDAAIVRTILALAQSLDLDVVAEGVETAGQLGFLRLHGCEQFQGYLFGRPVPAEVFEHELRGDRTGYFSHLA
ncbi:MAG: EAL domain-containing protein [Burkholderiales bacterium]|nr:EAL domain-containing protein [Burkholderiales bacterium]